MDDLYGDLPPSSAELGSGLVTSSSCSSSLAPPPPSGVALTGWSKLGGSISQSLPSGSNALYSESSTLNQVRKVDIPAGETVDHRSAKSSAPPKMLPFRPRQTNAAVAAASSVSQKQTSSGGSAAAAHKALFNPAMPSGGVGCGDAGNTLIAGNALNDQELPESNPCTFDVDGPYDPAMPNDYIEWCKARLERKRMRRLEEENIAQLEERRKAEKQREEERLMALASGDMVRVQASMGAGRGRGRLSNLPAWMTSGGEAPVHVHTSSGGGLSDSVEQKSICTTPSCAIVLNNIARLDELEAPGERDALESEIAQECHKYGLVINCKVSSDSRHCNSEVGLVSCVVVFDRLDGAAHALRDLDGRFFGGQRISASFLPEGDMEGVRQ